MGEPKAPFVWLVSIHIHEALVADGLEITDAHAERMLHHAFPLAPMSGMTARTVKAPSQSRIAKAQGFTVRHEATRPIITEAGYAALDAFEQAKGSK